MSALPSTLREAGAGWQSGILLPWEQGSSPSSEAFPLSLLWSRSLHCTKGTVPLTNPGVQSSRT